VAGWHLVKAVLVASEMTMAQAVPHRVGFWIVAGAFATLQAFGTVPTPLWPIYAVRDQLSSTEVTATFAALVVGAAFSLYFLGHLSDRFGRRRVIVPALLAGIAAGLVEASWPTLPGLLTGRVINGVAIGLMASTATTYLSDLYRAAHPDRTASRVPATVASVANLGGLALGPIVSGALARWAGRPLVLPYAVFLVLMALALIAILATPETVDRNRPLTGASRFALRDGQRATFGGAVAVAFCSFAVFGLFSSVGSLIVRGELHIASPFLWGVAGFVVLGVSAVAQTVFARLPLLPMLASGLAASPVGLAIVVYALYHPSLTAYLIGSGVAGAGAGLLFKAALSIAISTARAGATAGVLAMFFVVAYVGMGLPPILLAAATTVVSDRTAMIVFGVVIVAVSAIAARVQANALRPRVADAVAREAAPAAR
jgi:MFS family permease